MGNSDINDAIERQIALEDESRALGSDRYNSMRPLPWRTDPSAADDEAELPPGRQLLRLAVQPTAAAIRDFLDRANTGAARAGEAASILGRIGAEECAYLTARIVLNAVVGQMRFTATANAVAQALIDHIEMTALKENRKDVFAGLVKTQQFNRTVSRKKRKKIAMTFEEHGVKTDYSLSQRTRAGAKAIELLCDATGLFVIGKDSRKGRWVRATASVTEWLEEQHARCEILEPIHLPMIVPPRPWTSPFHGGYLTAQPGNRLVKQSMAAYHRDLIDHEMPAVYDAVNTIQNTAWRINTRVLEVLREVWDGGGKLGNLPHREPLDLPPLPPDFQTNEESKKGWKRAAADVHDHNMKSLSKRLAVSQRLWVAQKFAAEPAIYFPHCLDFRGRVYPIPTSGPSPQGDDIAKALLEFSEGQPIGDLGAGWLAVHIANLFGIDKVSNAERRQWVYQNTARIIDSADDPLDGERFWASADNPYMALAACFEWAGYMREGASFVSRLPVNLDGSNSGLQHFSALLRDSVGGRAVNLIPADQPQDIYGDVARRVQAIVDQSADERATPWKADRVTRKIAKQPCMTFTYSATRFGMHDMVYSTLREIDSSGTPHLDGDNYQAALYLSHVLFDEIGETVKAASSAMTWLRQASRVMTKAGLPIRWTSPVGLPVLQHASRRTQGTLAVYLRGKRVEVRIQKDAAGIDGRRQANSIAPNYVHSLDAAHLMAVANACHDAGIYDLAVVHDSFGVHAARVQELRDILRDTFANQYSYDWLSALREELAAQLPPEMADQLPALPPMGDLDIEAIRHSDYLFG